MRAIALDRARVMGVINVTPDSFSDGGACATPQAALRTALRMVEAGADMIDIGGESTRPGSAPVPPEEQIRRVVPAIAAIRNSGIDRPITVDTTRASVALAALEAGADAVNDTSAGRDDDAMLPLIAARSAGLVLMHRLTAPPRDRYANEHPSPPDYSAAGGVVAAVQAFLLERVHAALEAGVASDAIALDPGLGFGKSVAQNFALIAHTRGLADLGYPVVAGPSRKSFLGAAAGEADPRKRDAASHAAAAILCLEGASVIRAHDVAGAVHAARIADAIRAAASRPADSQRR